MHRLEEPKRLWLSKALELNTVAIVPLNACARPKENVPATFGLI
jgi:hypothetical protein